MLSGKLATTLSLRDSMTGERKAMLVNVTIPVFNEEARLKVNIPKLHRCLRDQCPFHFEVVIADNGSTDKTLEVASSLSDTHQGVSVIHLDGKGRGRAVKHAWNASAADILSYMDVDLSTDVAAFPHLIEALVGGYDVAVGSRRLNPSLTTRGLKREIISRCYMLLVKALFQTKFSDAQCGFKAITRSAAAALLPLVEDNGWFMDTELLILAETLGYRIFDFPVRWVDDPDSRVKILSTAVEDIKGLLRVRRNLAAGRYPTCAGTKPRHLFSAVSSKSAHHRSPSCA